MHHHNLLLAALALLAAPIAAYRPSPPSPKPTNYAYPPIDCGGPARLRCPRDMRCQRDPAVDCVAQNCPGLCVFRNAYENCGGHTIEPNLCDDPAALCVDDPRTPESCGMACDAPGICLSRRVRSRSCERNSQCRRGTWCYQWERDDCRRNNKGKCKGICM